MKPFQTIQPQAKKVHRVFMDFLAPEETRNLPYRPVDGHYSIDHRVSFVSELFAIVPVSRKIKMA